MKLPRIYKFYEFVPKDNPGYKNRIGGFSGGGIGSSESSQKVTNENQQVTLQGGGEGSSTIGTGAGSSGNVTVNTVDPAVVSSAFQFGAEAQTIASQEVGQGNATIENIAGELAALTANATPQTGAAEAENLATTPSSGGFDWNTAISAATLLGGLATILVFFRTRGSNT